MNVFKSYKAIFKKAIEIEKAGEVEDSEMLVLHADIIMAQASVVALLKDFKAGNPAKLQRMYSRLSYLLVDVEHHVKNKIL